MRTAIALILFAACTTESTVSLDSQDVEVAAAKKKSTTTVIRVNGLSVDSLLYDPATGTNGFVNVGRDQISNTTSLDFSYARPTSNPDIFILTQGAGQIPSSAFVRTANYASLVLPVTPFPITRCNVNQDDGTFTCTTGGPSIAWNLTWEANGFSEVEEVTARRQKIGPMTTYYAGRFFQRSALVNGTWNGATAVDISGNLVDTQNATITREITMEMN